MLSKMIKEFIIQDYIQTNKLNFKKSLFLRIFDIIFLILIFLYVLTKSCPHLQDNYENINCLPSTIVLSSTVFLKPNHFTVTIFESFNYKGENITNCKIDYNNIYIPINHDKDGNIYMYSNIYCDHGISFNPKTMTKSKNTEKIFNISYNYLNENKNTYKNLNMTYLQISRTYYDGKFIIGLVFNDTLYTLEGKERKDLEFFYYQFCDEYFNIIENQTIYTSYNCNSCYNNWNNFNMNSVYLILVGSSSLFSIYLSVKYLIIKYFFITENINQKNILK